MHFNHTALSMKSFSKHRPLVLHASTNPGLSRVVEYDLHLPTIREDPCPSGRQRKNEIRMKFTGKKCGVFFVGYCIGTQCFEIDFYLLLIRLVSVAALHKRFVVFILTLRHYSNNTHQFVNNENTIPQSNLKFNCNFYCK